MSLSDELSKLAELRASGSLTEEEFARAKERLLNAGQSAPGQSESSQSASGQPASGQPASKEPAVAAINAFRRSRSDRWLGGVCGGMARSTGMEAWVWRLLFTVLFIMAGAGLFLYVLLWIFVPSE